MQSIWFNRGFTFLVWLLAAGSAVVWGLKWVRGASVPLAAAQAAPAAAASTDVQSLAKALGGGQIAINSEAKNAANTAAIPVIPPLNAARFVLTGVVAGQTGVAVMAVDGKPARPYRVGAQLAPDVVLQSVAAGKAMLAASASGEVLLRLELPRQASALVGTVQPTRPVLAPVPAPALTAQGEAAAAANAAAGPKAARALASRLREAAEAPPAAAPAAPAQ